MHGLCFTPFREGTFLIGGGGGGGWGGPGWAGASEGRVICTDFYKLRRA